jgi:alkanesulfonate monooxygenase SsuD/methylene tetrahydromethanopterin reductase-like flavin-dependent oxidoreductase (luciferase family)
MPGRPVRFGVVFDFRKVPPGTKSFPEIYAETLELIGLADAVGIDYVYLSEHHFVEDGHSPSLLPIGAAVAARTERIRISSYVFLLPLHHPLRVAEDVATVDILSNGRAELGVGAGYRPEEFAAFGIDRAARRDRMDEGCEILLRAWTEDGWSHAGRQFQLENVSLYPKPVQRPHPPLWISARSPVAARRAGRFRTPLLIAPPPYVSDEQAVYDAYTTELRQAGGDPAPSGVAGSFNVVVTDDPESYRARVRPGAAYRARLYEQWYGETPDIRDDASRIATRPARRTGVIGDAAACVAALDQFLGGPIPYTHVIMAVEGAAELQAFASQVMPLYREQERP